MTSILENSKLVTLTYFLNSFVYKKSGAEVCKFLDYMDSPSQTYMKWPLNTIVLYLQYQSKSILSYAKSDLGDDDTLSTTSDVEFFKNLQKKICPKVCFL